MGLTIDPKTGLVVLDSNSEYGGMTKYNAATTNKTAVNPFGQTVEGTSFIGGLGDKLSGLFGGGSSTSSNLLDMNKLKELKSEYEVAGASPDKAFEYARTDLTKTPESSLLGMSGSTIGNIGVVTDTAGGLYEMLTQYQQNKRADDVMDIYKQDRDIAQKKERDFSGAVSKSGLGTYVTGQ